MRRLSTLSILAAVGIAVAAFLVVCTSEPRAGTFGQEADILDYLPRWSPDGHSIAFTRLTDGGYSYVYVVAFQGGRQTRLAEGDLPSWSGDGTRIAYYYSGGISTIKLDRSGRKRLTADGDWPLWSPDGRYILFKRGQDDTNCYLLYVVPAAGGKARRIAATADQFLTPAWSPDGTKVAFEIDTAGCGGLNLHPMTGIAVVGRDGRNLHQVTHGDLSASGPAFSPDGSEIAYWGRNAATGQPTLYVIPSAGGAKQKLFAGRGYPSGWPGCQGCVWSSPAYSPDGTRIAYSLGQSIWVIGSDGANPRRITHPSHGYADFNQTWSPDGRTLAFRRGSDTSTRIWLVNSDGTHERRLTH